MRGGYQNIEIPTCRQGHGHWGSKHTQTKRLLLSQDTVHKTETKAQANKDLIAAADSKNVRFLSHFPSDLFKVRWGPCPGKGKTLIERRKK